MNGPFVFIATHKIRDGKLDEFKKDSHQLALTVEEKEPQLHSFNFFLNDDETEVTVVQVHPDADSMLTHMQVARAQITESTEEQLETKDIYILGPPNDAVLGMVEQLTQEGVPITVKPRHHAGFVRR
jgi:quinol monooxygenase YgiN